MDHQITLHDKLDKLHERIERRRLNGKKPTRSQIKAMVRRTRYITTEEMLSKTNNIAYFVGVK